MVKGLHILSVDRKMGGKGGSRNGFEEGNFERG